jgi:hypothetical protein
MFSVSRVATPTHTEEQWTVTRKYRKIIIRERESKVGEEVFILIFKEVCIHQCKIHFKYLSTSSC